MVVRELFVFLWTLLVAAGVAAVAVMVAAAAPIVEMMIGGRVAVSGPSHLHFYRVQGAVDVDILGLGWGVFWGTFTSLQVFICGRQESMRAGQLSEEFMVGHAGFLGLWW